MGDGCLPVALGQLRISNRARAEFQMRLPSPLMQSGSWSNGKFLALIPAAQNSSQTQVSIHSKGFVLFSFLFSPEISQHRNNHWKSIF